MLSIDALTMENLYRGYKCHCCGHPTVDHVLGQQAARLVCTHKEMYHVLKAMPMPVFGSDVPEMISTYDVKERVCECTMEIMSDDFKLVHERHLEYCAEMDVYKADMKRDRLMQLCGTEL